MHHQQKADAVHRADGLPSMFAAFDPLDIRNMRRIGEHANGIVKSNFMLPQVCLRFDGVHSKSMSLLICSYKYGVIQQMSSMCSIMLPITSAHI
jgi:hypothetical protein